MREKIEEIRVRLDELEAYIHDSSASADRAIVSGLELPDIIRDVVDLLLPELKPYEAALYMYMSRHSVVENGSQLTRVSRRGLQSGVVKSAYADRTDRLNTRNADNAVASYKTVQSALEGLEAAGAISKQADPNREGTLFRVLLPEEIEICSAARQARSKEGASVHIDEMRDVDFYNVRENRLKVYERDRYQCRYCHKQLTRFTATLDHVTPVAESGDNSFLNLVTACLECNSRKNSRPVGDFLAERR